MKKIVATFFCFAGFSLLASPLLFRGGEVLRAELSTAEPAIASFDAALFPDLPERKIYAALTLALPAGRKISIFDYRLVVFGRAYDCVAIRNGDSPWKMTPDALDCRKASLLFILNRGTVGLDRETKITLQCAAPSSVPDGSEWKVTFFNIGEKPFSR
ncbi:MAG: hypothetical protein MJ016_07150 [Victivallaceae bacterium]|nr:hypothetical protein [Victivallaceae bacterium]